MAKHTTDTRKTRPVLSSRKTTAFGIATLLFLFLLLFALEAALRFAHYGPDLSLFIIENIHGTPYYTMNPDIKHRYFSRVDFTPATSPEYFTLKKKAGTYRIFCLGASTTVGYPYWYNAAFSSFLRDRLHAQFPRKDLEIINLGLTATNSYSVTDIARDVMDYEPDLLIVYDGHNEYYGALGIASTESAGSYRWLTLLYLRAEHLRTFQLFRSAFESAAALFTSADSHESRGTMMERLALGHYIPYASEQYRDGIEIFGRNLDDLLDIGATHRVPIMLSSQVSNLRDQYPFVSGPDPAASKTGGSFRTQFNRGVSLLDAGAAEQALAVFDSLRQADTLRADIHFMIGRCYQSLRRNPEALNEYLKARDNDQLRFRASSDLNAAIRKHCAERNGYFVDIERAFMEQSPDSLIGHELIIEHLHPTMRGYFLMAKEYARSMRLHHLFATDEEWNSAPVVDEEHLWEGRHVTVFDERLAARKTQLLTAAWPFTTATQPVIPNIPSCDTLGTIVENVVRGRWDWKVGHEQAAVYFSRRGQKDQAAKEYEAIIDQIPRDVQAYLSLAHVYLEQGRIDLMKPLLIASLGVEKTILACRALGDIAMKEDRPRDAAEYYEAMTQFPQTVPERLQNGTLLAMAQFRSGRTDLAKAQLQLVLQLNADYAPAKDLLSKIK